jgi:hypothetical protein
MEENKNINPKTRQKATAMDAFPGVCDGVVRWDDVKKAFTYSSSSSDSSLGRAWSSSSACFLLRVDIVADGMGGLMERVASGGKWWSE